MDFAKSWLLVCVGFFAICYGCHIVWGMAGALMVGGVILMINGFVNIHRDLTSDYPEVANDISEVKALILHVADVLEETRNQPILNNRPDSLS